MLSKRLIKSNDAGGGICQSDITDIFEDGSGVALYQLNWDGSDMSGNYDGVATDVSFVNGKIDSAGSFNGSSSYISLPDNSFNLTTLTLSVWINVTTFDGEKWIFDGYDEIPGLGKGFGITTHTGNKVKFRAWGSGFSEVISNTTLSTNTWYNVTCVATQSQAKVYINGSLDNTGSLTGIQYASAQKYNLGAIKKTGGNPLGYFTGKIDQVRIFNTAITDTNKIAQLAAETACVKTCTTDTPQLVPDCVAYYKLDGNADDSNGTATVYDGTPTNVSWTQGRLGSAAGFNGSSSKIDLPNFMPSGNAARSISMWVKTTTTAYSSLVRYGEGTNNKYFLFRVNSGTHLGVAFYANDYDVDVSSTNLFDGNWHQVGMTYDGTTIRLYVDGAEQGSGYNASSTNTTASAARIGYQANPNGSSAGSYFDGDIDQVRIYDREITSTEVTTLYNEVACPSGLNFNPVIYTGNGSTFNPVGGVEFQPDLVWIKARDTANSNGLYDSVRGAGNLLVSDLTAQNNFYSTVLNSFDSNGFTIGTSSIVNTNSDDYVAWCWRANGAAVTNAIGTITSDVSANQAAGFSIVKYSGTGTAQTIGHGLSSAPELIITKGLTSVTNWATYSATLGATKYLVLDGTNAAISTSAAAWNNTAPTSSVFSVGSGFSYTSGIAYCFHSVAGYQKVGSYTGSGTTNVVNTGFQPRFVMVKASSHASSWYIVDSARTDDNFLSPDLSNAEYTDSGKINFTSTGFTLTSISYNNSGYTWIYLAIA